LAEKDFAFSNLNLSYIPHYLFLLHWLYSRILSMNY
jgi:hypothetical protein